MLAHKTQGTRHMHLYNIHLAIRRLTLRLLLKYAYLWWKWRRSTQPFFHKHFTHFSGVIYLFNMILNTSMCTWWHSWLFLCLTQTTSINIISMENQENPLTNVFNVCCCVCFVHIFSSPQRL